LQSATKRIKIVTINRGIAIEVAPMNSTNGNAGFDARVIDEPIYCLGNCACSPAIVVGDDLCGRVTPDRFDEILFLVSRSERSR
jgi:NADH:ubiquinone oxidoreductase subunit E